MSLAIIRFGSRMIARTADRTPRLKSDPIQPQGPGFSNHAHFRSRAPLHPRESVAGRSTPSVVPSRCAAASARSIRLRPHRAWLAIRCVVVRGCRAFPRIPKWSSMNLMLGPLNSGSSSCANSDGTIVVASKWGKSAGRMVVAVLVTAVANEPCSLASYLSPSK